MLNWPKLIGAMAFLSLPLGWRAERRYRQMPPLGMNCKEDARSSPHPLRSTLPAVSIIVPARNEAANLRRLLPSLHKLDYPGKLEVIVVDDNSADETAVTAHNHGVRVLSLAGLPDGWLGKSHACHRGTAVARGDWLLFTDADTEHTPDGLTLTINYALKNQLDGLTCHLRHKTNGWLDGLALTAAFAGLFAGLPQNHTSLNGQYILLRRDVYEKSGGFAAVRREPLEDLALGRYLHGLGYRVPMLRGESVAKVAMYENSGQLWHGMSRMGAGALRWSGMGSLATASFITALMTPLLASGLVLARRLSPHWSWLAWATAVAGVWPWSHRFGVRWRVLFAPFGALFVQAAAVYGLLNRLIGRGIHWKGRKV